jgi:hypothetical protein
MEEGRIITIGSNVPPMVCQSESRDTDAPSA